LQRPLGRGLNAWDAKPELPKIAYQENQFYTADDKEPHVYVKHIAEIHISQVSTDLQA